MLWPFRIEESFQLTPGHETQFLAMSLRITRDRRGSLTWSWGRRELEDWTLRILSKITPSQKAFTVSLFTHTLSHSHALSHSVCVCVCCMHGPFMGP